MCVLKFIFVSVVKQAKPVICLTLFDFFSSPTQPVSACIVSVIVLMKFQEDVVIFALQLFFFDVTFQIKVNPSV